MIHHRACVSDQRERERETDKQSGLGLRNEQMNKHLKHRPSCFTVPFSCRTHVYLCKWANKLVLTIHTIDTIYTIDTIDTIDTIE